MWGNSEQVTGIEPVFFVYPHYVYLITSMDS